MNSHINYIELYANHIESIKDFYTTCFGWEFTDYGSDYVAFSNSGIAGGFEKTDNKTTVNSDHMIILVFILGSPHI